MSTSTSDQRVLPSAHRKKRCWRLCICGRIRRPTFGFARARSGRSLLGISRQDVRHRKFVSRKQATERNTDVKLSTVITTGVRAAAIASTSSPTTGPMATATATSTTGDKQDVNDLVRRHYPYSSQAEAASEQLPAVSVFGTRCTR